MGKEREQRYKLKAHKTYPLIYVRKISKSKEDMDIQV
jgi:hypothetical protein